MKKKTKLLIGLGALFALTLVSAACAVPDLDDENLVKAGYTYVVEYDRNGGLILNSAGLGVYDRFNEKQADKGFKLLEPGDPARGGNAITTSRVRRNGYFLIGWYRNETPAVNAEGKPIDEDGNVCNVERDVLDENGEKIPIDPEYDEEGNLIPKEDVYDEEGHLIEKGYEYLKELVSENGKPQNIVYSGRWNFDTDIAHASDFTEGKDAKGRTEHRLVLHAAWSPEFTYSFRYQDEKGEWQEYKTAILPSSTLEQEGEHGVPYPAWSPTTGRIDMGGVPARDGYTFLNAYADPDMQTPFQTSIPHEGEVDYERGVTVNRVTPVYTTWREGNWFKVYTAKQFSDNYAANASFELMDNLDFSGTAWTRIATDYAGTIEGNNRTISNITGTQNSNSVSQAGGIFGSLTEKAVLRNVTFENITFSLQNGTSITSTSYGLFAGRIESGATLENVHITSGTIRIGRINDTNNYTNYTIGLLSGNRPLDPAILDPATVTVEVQSVKPYIGSDGTRYDEGWPVTATVKNGKVTVERNPNPGVDPNLAASAAALPINTNKRRIQL